MREFISQLVGLGVVKGVVGWFERGGGRVGG